MPRRKSSTYTSSPNQGLKKFFLSAFVVFAFVGYAIHERLTSSNGGLASNSGGSNSGSSQDASGSSSSSASNASVQQASASGSSSSQASYKNGTYTGPDVNVFYGLVKVQATVQGGKIANVQFLDYPSDRRTSQRINSIAMPYLQQEALQVQSANVNIISGATLTSEGFQMSLQSALASAH